MRSSHRRRDARLVEEDQVVYIGGLLPGFEVLAELGDARFVSLDGPESLLFRVYPSLSTWRTVSDRLTGRPMASDQATASSS